MTHDYQLADLLDVEELLLGAPPLVVVRTSPLGTQKEVESRQSVRRATEGLHGGVGRKLKSLGAVAESGQTKKHMADLPRVSASPLRYHAYRRCRPSGLPQKGGWQNLSCALGFFFGCCHFYVSSQYQILFYLSALRPRKL
jgi:hypothetical protein